MKTVFRYAGRVRSKILIALGRPVSADDVNLGVRAADGLGGIRQKVEKPGIEVMHLSGAVVAQEMVQLRQGLGNIGCTVAIHDIQTFSRVSVVEPQMAVLYRGRSTGYGYVGNNRHQDENANTQNVLPLDCDRAKVLLV